jgi:hypothetical protein
LHQFNNDGGNNDDGNDDDANAGQKKLPIQKGKLPS